MNPILEAMNQRLNPLNNISQIKNMMQMAKGAKDPNAFLANIANQNPQMKQAMTYAKSCKNPKEAFFKMAKEKGVNPEEILSLLR